MAKNDNTTVNDDLQTDGDGTGVKTGDGTGTVKDGGKGSGNFR